MVDLMGRIGSANSSHCPHSALGRNADSFVGVRHHGTLASVDGGAHHRGRDNFARPAGQSECHRHLTSLLTPLHGDPATLAARLLHRFGSIGRFAQASETELRQTANSGEHWVDIVLVMRQLIRDGLREEFTRTRLGDNQKALFSYLILTMQNLSEERMIAIYADAAGYIISEEVIAEGDETHVLVTPRRVFRRALNIDAHRILLAHNHPSGSANPSARDVEHTQLLCRKAADLGLHIEDHLIVGAREVTSMRERGLM